MNSQPIQVTPQRPSCYTLRPSWVDTLIQKLLWVPGYHRHTLHAVLMALCLIGFTLVMPLSRSGVSNFYYWMLLIGIWGLWKSTQPIGLDQAEKMIIAIVCLWFAVASVSYIANGMPAGGEVFLLKRYSKVVCALFLLLYFKRFPLNLRMLWWLSIIFLVEVGVIALLEAWDSTLFRFGGRASGNIHPINFALFTCVIMAMAVSLHSARTRYCHWLLGAAIVAGLYAIFQSGSRGVWVVIPVLGYVLIGFFYRRASIKPMMIYTLMVVLLSLFSYKHPYVESRVDAAVEEVEAYWQSESADDPVRFSSLGGRLEMWRASGVMVENNPWLGVGPGGFAEQAKMFVATGEWSAKLLEHGYPHNIYITALSTQGALGLITLLTILLGLCGYYLKGCRSSSVEERKLALAGLLLTISYMVAGLSADNMGHKLPLTVFAVLQAVILGNMRYFNSSTSPATVG